MRPGVTVRVRATLSRLWADNSGATAIEYALVGGIMMVAVVGVIATGGALDSIYQRVYKIVAATNG